MPVAAVSEAVGPTARPPVDLVVRPAAELLHPLAAGSDPTRPRARRATAEREALRTALENEGTSPETLKAKLAAVRGDPQEVGRRNSRAAREDLQKVLTVRQEALLVSYGILE